jgi:hypothetical protein
MKSEGQRQSQKHEKRLADKYDGQVNAASGAFWSRKGDVRNAALLFEHKYTSKMSMSVKRVDLDKIEKEAVLDSRMPVFAVHIGGRNYVILTEDDFDALLEDPCGRTEPDA